MGAAPVAKAQTKPPTHAIERPVPLGPVQVMASHLRHRVLGNSSNAQQPFFWPDYTEPGNQFGQGIHLKQPGWLEAVSFHVAACSYDSLFLRIHVYALAQGFPGAALLPQLVAVRLARASLANRVVLDLRPYHVWLSGDAVVALEILRAQGSGTLTFSAARVPGPLYVIDLPGSGANRNFPPRGTARQPLFWQQSPTTTWRKATTFSLGIDATVLQVAN
ncbi:hypothetical protein GCM10023172_03550 [Hymenobacter ginsengisoli]|uniref:Uncharacterized protein n=2 Tax=Hymenobacteraceae TaxID=1853232 RepID=A0ABP8PXV9_9BACT